jgi:hypothetical protein
MERRKFVIGLGALATGSAAATGTGAFTSMTTGSRDANIQVVNDNNGLIALQPQLPSETVSLDNGELYIDMDPKDKGTGINPDSEYSFGTIPVPYNSNNDESAAFHIQNSDTVEHDITVTWTQEQLPEDVEWPLYVRFYVGTKEDDGDRPYDENGDEAYALVDPARGNSSTGSVTRSVSAGDYAAVAFKIVAGKLDTEAETPLDFSGTFTVEAE